MLGNNMFAYCLNNPTNFVDWTGYVSIWYYLIVDSDMGFIHRAVQAHIRSSYQVMTEVRLQTYGRADILNNKGEVWEIKHAGRDPEARTAIAYAQANSYVMLNDEVTGLGSADAYSGNFYIGCQGNSYLVEYETPCSGVVLYTVSTIDGYTGEYAYVYTPVNSREDEKRFGAGLVLGGVLFGFGSMLGNLRTTPHPQNCLADIR